LVLNLFTPLRKVITPATQNGAELTYDQPDEESQPRLEIQLNHQIDIEEDADTWDGWHRGRGER